MPPLRPCHSRRERAGIVPPAPPHIRHSRRPAIVRRLARQSSFGRLRSRRRQPPLTLPAPECPKRPETEEHTSELQSLMRISYAVFCLKKKKKKQKHASPVKIRKINTLQVSKQTIHTQKQ